MKSGFGSRLAKAIKERGFNNNSLSKIVHIHPTTLKNWITGHTAPDNLKLDIVIDALGINKEWLIDEKGEMLTNNVYAETERKTKTYPGRTPVRSVNDVKAKYYTSTLSVKVVTTKARAGFTEAYYSEEYLADLPTVLIEADKDYKGNYLAFEVDGDSMEPEYNAGDVVICREVQRSLWQYKLHYKDFDFVIAHGTKGIMLKEITSHNPETGEIVCHSLNEGVEDFTLNLREVAFLYNVVEHRISGRAKRRNR